MQVEIWSDIVCPWCYIGRRRFETALRQFDNSEQVEVVWRSFQLDPTSPRESPAPVSEALMKKYGIGGAQVEAMHQQVTDLAALEGLEYHLENTLMSNTLDAHRLIHFAAAHGLQSEMKERLQKAYFTEGWVVSDHDTLARLAGEVGLNAGEARQMLESDSYADAVRADIQEAQSLGISGVPFFLIDRKFAVSGAQPADLFLSALNRAWSESHPVIEIISEGGADTGACTDESCAV